MMSTAITLRHGRFSARVRRRTLLVGTALGLALVVTALLTVSTGSTWIAPSRILEIVTGGGTQAARYQVLELRLPRTLIGILSGAGLALSGALLQAAARNPLASPDVLGITSGASIGAVAVFVLGFRIFGAPLTISLPVSAILGGTAAALLVSLLSRGGPPDGLRLVLIGIGVNAALVGLIQTLLVAGGTFDVLQAQVWLTGDLSSDSRRLWPLAITIGVLAVVAACCWPALCSLQLGQEVAHTVGVPVKGLFRALMGCSVLAAAVAVSATGPLGFVALAAPQFARLLTGSRRPSPGLASLCGALLTLCADIIARTVLNGHVSVGLVTATIGGPVLVTLLLRRVRNEA